jgi:D-alanyl-D-alanine carboxypeptidase
MSVLATGALAGVLLGGSPPANASRSGHRMASAGRSMLPPLDPAALRKAIAGLPNADATAAIVQVRGPADRWHPTSGVTDLHSRQPVPDNVRFRIGSITKVFIATVVLQLAAQHKINLDGPSSTTYPAFSRTDTHRSRSTGSSITPADCPAISRR